MENFLLRWETCKEILILYRKS